MEYIWFGWIVFKGFGLNYCKIHWVRLAVALLILVIYVTIGWLPRWNAVLEGWKMGATNSRRERERELEGVIKMSRLIHNVALRVVFHKRGEKMMNPEWQATDFGPHFWWNMEMEEYPPPCSVFTILHDSSSYHDSASLFIPIFLYSFISVLEKSPEHCIFVILNIIIIHHSPTWQKRVKRTGGGEWNRIWMPS